MGQVTVTPDEFVLTLFINEEIRLLTQRIADTIGIPADQPIQVDVNESTPLRRVSLVSVAPITVTVESGALEDPRRPRWLSPLGAEASLAKVLFRARDRIDGSFGDAPAEDKVGQGAMSAWNAYSVGRSERVGFYVQKQRQLYDFRNRHQFSDAADAVFDRLWGADSLTWTDLSKLSASVS